MAGSWSAISCPCVSSENSEVNVGVRERLTEFELRDLGKSHMYARERAPGSLCGSVSFEERSFDAGVRVCQWLTVSDQTEHAVCMRGIGRQGTPDGHWKGPQTVFEGSASQPLPSVCGGSVRGWKGRLLRLTSLMTRWEREEGEELGAWALDCQCRVQLWKK